MSLEIMYSSNSCEWETPQEFYNKLDQEFKFTLDPCATAKNHVTLNKKYAFGLDLINQIENKLKPAKTIIEYYDNNLHLKFKYYN